MTITPSTLEEWHAIPLPEDVEDLDPDLAEANMSEISDIRADLIALKRPLEALLSSGASLWAEYSGPRRSPEEFHPKKNAYEARRREIVRKKVDIEEQCAVLKGFARAVAIAGDAEAVHLESKLASLLRETGWVCLPPQDAQ